MQMVAVEVSRELNQCQKCKIRDTGSVVDKNRSSRSPKCSERDTRLLSRNAKKELFLSVQNLGVQSNLISMVSVRTLRRYLHMSLLSARASARKPLLSKLEVKRRIQWCKAYSSFEAIDLNQVIFLDESRVHSTRRYVWRPRNFRHNSNYICKTVKYGGMSLLVWGQLEMMAKESS